MDRPKLRPVEAFPVDVGGREAICLRDPTHLIEDAVFVPREALFIVALFDGNHTILDIQEAYTRQSGQLLYSDVIKALIAELDERLLLDNERFETHKHHLLEAFRKSPVRRAAHAGSAYEADPSALTAQLAGYFADLAEPEAAAAPALDGPVLGILSPHIDPRRGGPCFARAYEAIRQVTAELFVIFGTAHQPTSVPFPLTLKDFETPLGIVETDKAFVRALARHYPTELLSDELAHRSEHSIEFQVLFLQYVLGPARRFRVVPILVGSFHECVERQVNPAEMVHIADFIQAIRQVATERPEPVCYIVGGDLAHVGMKFGDQGRLTPAFLGQVAREDHALLTAAARMDAEGFFRVIAEHHDRRRICGLAPTYMLLSTMPATAGAVLQYDQAVEPATQSMVSYASMVFY
ncbi:MAG TPA: AmmeMemoRadiSam system protein B [Candidatus Tectomicrobia bacterium]|nr:AmmeMemoRadiSam system protein B [Candidatus Tectomicrobia bacterium]